MAVMFHFHFNFLRIKMANRS
jgi:hypothetical protein